VAEGSDQVGSKGLHITNAHALFQRSQFVGSGGNEFLCDKSFEAGLHYGSHDGRVVEFLRFVYFVSAGNTSGVEV
jgi:hypothetical protein